MSWLRRSKKEKITPSTEEQKDAAKALGKAEERLERSEHETGEILAVTEKLKELGKRNDFAAKIKEAMGG